MEKSPSGSCWNADSDLVDLGWSLEVSFSNKSQVMLTLLVLGNIKIVDFPSCLWLLPISETLQGILYAKSRVQLKSVRRDDKTNNHIGKYKSHDKYLSHYSLRSLGTASVSESALLRCGSILPRFIIHYCDYHYFASAISMFGFFHKGWEDNAGCKIQGGSELRERCSLHRKTSICPKIWWFCVCVSGGGGLFTSIHYLLLFLFIPECLK